MLCSETSAPIVSVWSVPSSWLATAIFISYCAVLTQLYVLLPVPLSLIQQEIRGYRLKVLLTSLWGWSQGFWVKATNRSQLQSWAFTWSGYRQSFMQGAILSVVSRRRA